MNKKKWREKEEIEKEGKKGKKKKKVVTKRKVVFLSNALHLDLIKRLMKRLTLKGNDVLSLELIAH